MSSVHDAIVQVRRYLRRRAGLAVALGGVGIAGCVLLIAWAMAGPEGWTPGTPVPALLLGAGVVGLTVLTWWILARLGGWSREERLAAEIERTSDLPRGSVRSQVDFGRGVPSGVSSSLVRAGERSVLSRMRGGPEQLSGRPGEQLGHLLRLAGGGAAVALVLVLAASLVSPDRARAAWSGLVRPAALLATPPLPPLELRPGSIELPRGDEPEVAVRAEGRESVTVHWQGVGEVLQERTLPVDEGIAELRLPPLEVRVRYWASSEDGARTAEATLSPSDPSVLTDVLVEVAYPEYTRLPAETFRSVPAWLQLPEGTTLAVSGGMAGAGEEVRLLREDGEPAARAPVDGGRFEARWRPTRSGTLRWDVVGGPVGAVVPPPIELEIVRDAPPTVELGLPEAGSDLPLSLEVPIDVEAGDDYGVAWIEIETLLRRPGEQSEPVIDRIPTADRTEVELTPTLGFSGWGLRPGDEVLVRVRAADNAPTPQRAETSYRRLVVPRAEEVRDAARRSIEQASDEAASLLEQVREEARQLRDLERRSEMTPEPSRRGGSRPDAFEEREDLRDAVERQTAMADQVDELRSGLEQASRSLDETMAGNQEAAELRERIEALERQLEEIADPEARERLEELSEGLREGELPLTQEEVLEELSQRQTELQAQLEQTLDQLRQARLEEQFRGAEEEIESLMETQQSLTEELARGEGEEAQAEQAERADSLQSRLEELGESLTAEGEAESAQRTEEAGRSVEEAGRSMEQAAEQSRSGENEAASDEAEQARQELQQALQELQQTREEMAAEEQRAAEEGLRRGAQDALSLARRQAELRERISREPFIPEGELENEAAAILEGVRNLQSEMEANPQQAPGLSQQMSEALSEAAESMEQTVEGLQGASGSPEPAGASEAAQGALNEMAMMAMEGLGGRGGESSQEGSGGEATEEDLTSLSEQQQSLNQQTEQISQQQSGPDGTPVPAELDDVVAGQRGISAMLREMADRETPGVGQGNLEALSEESDEIADELRQGRLDATTRARQEQFVQRLLSAGRSLEQDGPTEEREGTTAEAAERRAVTALPEGLLQSTAIELPTTEELEALPPGQRQLVLDYFDRVNRRRAAEGMEP